jgi:hypothetical protein
MARMWRTVWLRARIKIDDVSARWPMTLIPGRSALSLMPVAQKRRSPPRLAR